MKPIATPLLPDNYCAVPESGKMSTWFADWACSLFNSYWWVTDWLAKWVTVTVHLYCALLSLEKYWFSYNEGFKKVRRSARAELHTHRICLSMHVNCDGHDAPCFIAFCRMLEVSLNTRTLTYWWTTLKLTL